MRTRSHRRRLVLESLDDRIVLSSLIPLNSTTWTPMGPASINNGQIPGRGAVSGRIDGIAADPTNPNLIYIAASSGGVWKTTNAGTSWTPLTDNEINQTMGSIATAPSNPNIIYAATGDGDGFTYGRGILKSTDAGATWTLLSNNPFDRHGITRVVVSPTDPNTVYAAVSSVSAVDINGLPGNTGIWKSADGGATWTNTTTTISTTGYFMDLVMDPSSPNTLYAGVGRFGESESGLYKTTDGGGTWNRAGNFPAGTVVGRIAVAISKTDPKTLYASIADPQRFGLSQMLKSTDAGVTWAATVGTPPNYLGGQGWYDTAIAVDPKDANVVFVAGQTASFSNGNFVESIEESRDGGTTWTDITIGLDGNGIHVDNHTMAFDANNKLLLGNDGGIWRLDTPIPGAVHWTDLNSNLQITEFTGIALTSDPNIAYGGSQDNGTEKFTDNLAWTNIQFGDGGFVRADPTNPNVVYHTFFSGFNGFLERSDDGGATWAPKTNGITVADPSNFYVPYIMDPSNPSRLLLGTNRVYETTTRADTWTPISAANTNGWNTAATIDAIATAKTDGNTIYATAGGHIFVTINDGGAWTQVDVPGVTDRFNDLQVDPTNSLIAYAARNVFGGGHIFRTADGGKTWTNISGNLPDVPADSIALDSRPGNNIIYLGTDSGVYFSANQGASWAKFRAGFPNVRVSNLELNTTLNILAAGTFGRGMFEIALTDTIQLTVLPPNPTEGQPLGSVVVANFIDQAGADPLTNYTATIDWGDGTPPSTGTVVADGKGGFNVLANHTYSEEGPFTLTVTVLDSDGTSNKKTASVTVADAALTAVSTASVSANEGDTVKGLKVASFTDADPQGMVSDYTATIDWGDGTTSTGTITANTSGGFDVTADHTFVEGGVLRVTVTIADSGGSKATTSFTATIIDPPLTATGMTLNATEGSPIPIIVASFTDADPVTTASEYKATINWGDGTTTPGTVVPNAAGGYSIQGTHGFEEGSYTIVVTVVDLGGSTASVSSPITVTDAPITATGFPLTGFEGVSTTGVVATFVDGNASAPVSDFTAIITWGNGSTSAGTIVSKGGGNFQVIGTNRFVNVGNFPISVAIQDKGGSRASTSSTAVIADAPLEGSGGLVVQFEGVAFTVVVGSFTDLNPLSKAGDFKAIINWGDNISSAGIIRANSSGGFDVIGSHVFDAGAPLITVTIYDKDGATTTAISTANIKDAPLTSTGTFFLTTEMTPGSFVLATFTDLNPRAVATDFTAVIAWGDGTSSRGTVSKVGGVFSVAGSHTYVESGTYPVFTTIRDKGGSTTVALSATVTADLVVPIIGLLNPASDSGVSQHDNITNITQPNFLGFAEPNTIVNLFARRSDQPGPIFMGQAVSDFNGAWSINTLPFADGTYVITATATDSGGHTSPQNLLLPSASQGPLIIDTIGPKVVNSQLNPRTGQVLVTFQDTGGGLSPSTLLNPANYSLVNNDGSGQAFGLRGLALAPGSPAQVTVTATFALGGRSGQASYVLTLPALGITDAAGNPLVEKVFIAFPQLTNSPPGNYIAEFNTNGQNIALAQQNVPKPAIIASNRFTRFARGRTRVRPGP